MAQLIIDKQTLFSLLQAVKTVTENKTVQIKNNKTNHLYYIDIDNTSCYTENEKEHPVQSIYIRRNNNVTAE